MPSGSVQRVVSENLVLVCFIESIEINCISYESAHVALHCIAVSYISRVFGEAHCSPPCVIGGVVRKHTAQRQIAHVSIKVDGIAYEHTHLLSDRTAIAGVNVGDIPGREI